MIKIKETQMNLLNGARRMYAHLSTNPEDFKTHAMSAFKAMNLDSQSSITKQVKELGSSDPVQIWGVTVFEALDKKDYNALDIATKHGAKLDAVIALAVENNDAQATRILLNNGANPSSRVSGTMQSIFDSPSVKVMDFPLLGHILAGSNNTGGSKNEQIICDLLDAGESTRSLASTTINERRDFHLMLVETFDSFSPISRDEYKLANSMRRDGEPTFNHLEQARLEIKEVKELISNANNHELNKVVNDMESVSNAPKAPIISPR